MSETSQKEVIPTPYEDLLREILEHGTDREDRTGTGTRGVFGRQIRYDLQKGFPLITSKKVFTKGIVAELLWLLSGDTNIGWLNEQGVHIWDKWADEYGDLGPVYGAQWRRWQGYYHCIDCLDDKHASLNVVHDQIAAVVENIRSNPESRRHIVSAWNVMDLDSMALPPCHVLFQFYVSDGKLSCQLYQRSADMFLGVPFNIASYALLTHMVAQQTGLDVGEFVWTVGDAHIYSNHFEQVREQLSRLDGSVAGKGYLPYPTLHLNKAPTIFDYALDDVEFRDYNPYPAISAPVAV